MSELNLSIEYSVSKRMIFVTHTIDKVVLFRSIDVDWELNVPDEAVTLYCTYDEDIAYDDWTLELEELFDIEGEDT